MASREGGWFVNHWQRCQARNLRNVLPGTVFTKFPDMITCLLILLNVLRFSYVTIFAIFNHQTPQRGVMGAAQEGCTAFLRRDSCAGWPAQNFCAGHPCAGVIAWGLRSLWESLIHMGVVQVPMHSSCSLRRHPCTGTHAQHMWPVQVPLHSSCGLHRDPQLVCQQCVAVHPHIQSLMKRHS